MRISPEGADWLMAMEGGTRLRIYLDPIGIPTIGVGHVLSRSEMTSGKMIVGGEKVRWEQGINSAQALALFEQDLDPAEDAVSAFVKISLAREQFDALVSFTFNVGIGAFERSTLLKRINSRRFDDVPFQMMRWVFAGGKKILVERRKCELHLWNTGEYRTQGQVP